MASARPNAAAPAASEPAGRPRPTLTLKNYFAYAAGDFANNLSFSMASMFLILYYTNVVGIEGAVIGTMFLVVRFVDAITDVIAGSVVDSRKPGKLGKFRPWILWFAAPLLIMNFLIFSAKLIFPDLDGTAAVAYMYVTYILMGSVFYTLVNIPFGSMAPAMTQDPQERGKLASFRMYGAMLGLLFLAFVVGPAIRGIKDPTALQERLALVTGGFVVLGIALYAFMVWGTRENVHRTAEKTSIVEGLRTLRSNTPLILLSVSAVLFLTGMTALSTLGSYIAIYVQQDAGFIAWNTLGQVLPIFVVGPMVPLMVRTLGKRSAYIATGLFTIVGALMLAFLPLPTNPWLGPLSFFVIGIGIAGVNTLMWALEADTVEYGEWKSGFRTEGVTYAVFSFNRKMGQALGGFVGGWALSWAGFSAAAAASKQAQAPEVPANIQMWAALLLGGFTLLSLIVVRLYPLTEARYGEIVEEIRSRKQEATPAGV